MHPLVGRGERHAEVLDDLLSLDPVRELLFGHRTASTHAQKTTPAMKAMAVMSSN